MQSTSHRFASKFAAYPDKKIKFHLIFILIKYYIYNIV